MSRKASGAFSEFWEIVKTLLWAAIIAIVIRTFAYEPFNIPSGSMIPTLLEGDYLFVSKMAYGYSKFSFPGGLVPIEGRIWEGEPKRGEVVVFRPSREPDTDFIKRVIGLPGDRIQMRQGLLYINDVPVERQRIEDYVDPDNPTDQVPQYLETLPGGVTHRIIERFGDRADSDNTQTFIVPAGHYFMMGDNRDGSNDSRALSPANFIASVKVGDNQGMELAEAAFNERCRSRGIIDESNKDCLATVGFVPKENLIGPAKILFWSYGSSFRWYNPVTWATALRFGRLLNVIQ
ncbi:signal peptidase I [Dongia deserti]|uniref:signal peptidase I n=1 Tax=Dongia deserti TaxID=2268030 RepID=UPI000E6509D8|nr:signal peptidase I [Dongia deserti]